MSDLAKKNEINIERIKEFQIQTTKEPSKSEVKFNEMAGNAKYIPIGVLEKKLDETYLGLWKTSNGHYEVIANSLTYSIDLEVLHPVLGIWIKRNGVGAVPIQLQKGQKEMNFSTINTFAIQKGLPSAKSFALRNAIQSLGDYFGRGLNREEINNSDYSTVFDRIEDIMPLKERALELLETSTITGNDRGVFESQITKASIEKLNDIIVHLKKKQTKK